jgi:hypothetical protein
MPNASPEQAAADATRRFLDRLPPETLSRLEAQVSSRRGMPLLCAVEAALAGVLPRAAVQELVWLGAPPDAGAHLLRLKALGPDGAVLGEEAHELEG